MMMSNCYEGTAEYNTCIFLWCIRRSRTAGILTFIIFWFIKEIYCRCCLQTLVLSTGRLPQEPTNPARVPATENEGLSLTLAAVRQCFRAADKQEYLRKLEKAFPLVSSGNKIVENRNLQFLMWCQKHAAVARCQKSRLILDCSLKPRLLQGKGQA